MFGQADCVFNIKNINKDELANILKKIDLLVENRVETKQSLVNINEKITKIEL